MSGKHPKNQDSGFDKRAYKLDLVKALLQETFKIIAEEEKRLGKDFATELATDYLGSYVASLVTGALKSPAIDLELTEEAQYRKAYQLFLAQKQEVQSAIEQAFSTAFQAFNPDTIPEYECKIECIDDGISAGVDN